MAFETRVTWEKLVLELRHLKPDDLNSLIPLLIGTNAVIWPKDGVEACFRQVNFLDFELSKLCEGLSEQERFEKLRSFFFEQKDFQIRTSRLSEAHEQDFMMKSVLNNRAGHPLPIALLFLHLAGSIDIPIFLMQARHHYVLKWVRAGQPVYVDLLQQGLILSDEQLLQILQKSSSNLEIWDARSIYSRYLEDLMRVYEQEHQSQLLHTLYNLSLHLDEANLPVLGRRALLRQRLGFAKEALTDLKRYFSFVERGHAPVELQRAFIELETLASQPPPSGMPPTETLH